MRNKISKLLKMLKKDSSEEELSEVLSLLRDIKKILIISTLKTELTDFSSVIGDLGNKDADDRKDPNSTDLKVTGEKKELNIDNKTNTLDQLKDIAANKMENGKLLFLLHRPTENFEYSNSADNTEYETSQDTEWFAEYMSGEINQDGQNPVVSCWVPEYNVIGSPMPHDNTGTWGELGKSPFAEVFKVSVKPGKYKIYQELRQRI